MTSAVRKAEEKCRICNETDTLIDTWAEEFTHIHDKLQAVTDSEGENWLRFMCICCKEQLDSLWAFKIQCKNAYRLFLDEMEQLLEGSDNLKQDSQESDEEHLPVGEYLEEIETVLVKMDNSEENESSIAFEDCQTKADERNVKSSPRRSRIIKGKSTKKKRRKDLQAEDSTAQPDDGKKRRAWNQPCTCAICHIKLSSKNNLKGHIKRKHLNLRPYLCESCGYKCYNKYALNQHELVHAKNPSRFPCTLCDKTFTREVNMKRHLQIHLNPTQKRQNKRQCRICREKFKTKEDFTKHMESHSETTIDGRILRGNRRKVCSFCGKEFKLPAQLIIHERKHTGEKPFVCEICSKAFRQKQHLNTHMNVHNNDRRYKCTDCDKVFTENGSLTVHRRIHTGETPYQCPTCLKKFYELKMCKNHSKKCAGLEQDQAVENTNLIRTGVN